MNHISASDEERQFLDTGLKAGVLPIEMYLALMLSRLTGKSIQEVRDTHFQVHALMRNRSQMIISRFIHDVDRSLHESEKIHDKTDGEAGSGSTDL